MRDSPVFFRSILDSVTEHIVVIDRDGVIQYVNKPWVDFACANGASTRDADEWCGVNYIGVCDAAEGPGCDDGHEVAAGTRAVIEGRAETYYHEYPCHCPTEDRWFIMRVTPLQSAERELFTISHQNITKRKLAEERAHELSLTDGLTGLANRRHFDDFLAQEWRRGVRYATPVSLLLIDIDDFKDFNDHHGHGGGDELLRGLAHVLASFSKRPGDLAARFGGDEFALVLGDTDAQSSTHIAQQVLRRVRGAGWGEDRSSPAPTATVSIGVATARPTREGRPDRLLELADTALYVAKSGGRDRVALSPASPI